MTSLAKHFFENVESGIVDITSADCTSLSSEDNIWPSGFLCCRPDGLELTTDQIL